MLNQNLQSSQDKESSPNETTRLRSHRSILGGDASLIRETVHGSNTKRLFFNRLRSTVKIFLSVTILCFIFLYIFGRPYMISILPAVIASPTESMDSYKRVVSGFHDYFPMAKNDSSGGISDIGRGGIISFLSNAFMVPGDGYEGILQLQFDNTGRSVERPDVEIGYRMIDDSSSGESYLQFSNWPEALDLILPASLAGDSWMVYESESNDSHQTMSQLLHVFSQEGSKDRYTFSDILWNHAFDTKVLDWKIKDIMRRKDDGEWVTDIVLELRRENLSRFIRKLDEDPEYWDPLKTVDEGVRFIDLLASMRELKILVSIGTFDRLLYDMIIQYDIFHHDVGTLRGEITSSLVKTNETQKIAKPSATKRLNDLLLVANLFDNFFLATSNDSEEIIDTDEDGLSDADEIALDTDPNNPDTDQDGFNDGDEILAGYNPKGDGKLIE